MPAYLLRAIWLKSLFYFRMEWAVRALINRLSHWIRVLVIQKKPLKEAVIIRKPMDLDEQLIHCIFELSSSSSQDQIKTHSRLVEDLGFDSIVLTILLTDISESYGIDIQLEDYNGIRQVQELQELIHTIDLRK